MTLAEKMSKLYLIQNKNNGGNRETQINYAHGKLNFRTLSIYKEDGITQLIYV